MDAPVRGLVGEVAEHAAGEQGPAGIDADEAGEREQQQEQADAVERGGHEVIGVLWRDVVVAVDDERGDASGRTVGSQVEEAAMQPVLDQGPQQPSGEHQAQEVRQLEGPTGAPQAGGDQREVEDVRRGRVRADEALVAVAVEEARRPGPKVRPGLGAEGGGEQLVGQDGGLRHDGQ